MGLEFDQIRTAEKAWVQQLVEPFTPFWEGDDFDPIERLLTEYKLPDFLVKALLLQQKQGSQPQYSEDVFSNNGSPNYTRILVKLGKLTSYPGLRGRKASNHDIEAP